MIKFTEFHLDYKFKELFLFRELLTFFYYFLGYIIVRDYVRRHCKTAASPIFLRDIYIYLHLLVIFNFIIKNFIQFSYFVWKIINMHCIYIYIWVCIYLQSCSSSTFFKLWTTTGYRLYILTMRFAYLLIHSNFCTMLIQLSPLWF